MESRRRRSRSQLLKWGCYVLALFVCAALQTTPGLFQLGEAKPLLVLPLCLAVAVFAGEFAGAPQQRRWYSRWTGCFSTICRVIPAQRCGMSPLYCPARC